MKVTRRGQLGLQFDKLANKCLRRLAALLTVALCRWAKCKWNVNVEATVLRPSVSFKKGRVTQSKGEHDWGGSKEMFLRQLLSALTLIARYQSHKSLFNGSGYFALIYALNWSLAGIIWTSLVSHYPVSYFHCCESTLTTVELSPAGILLPRHTHFIYFSALLWTPPLENVVSRPFCRHHITIA